MPDKLPYDGHSVHPGTRARGHRRKEAGPAMSKEEAT